MTDTRNVENDERQAARHYRYVGENVLAEQHERAANAIAAERAARERAEALLAEADKRVVWESVPMRRDFQEDVEAVLGKEGTTHDR